MVDTKQPRTAWTLPALAPLREVGSLLRPLHAHWAITGVSALALMPLGTRLSPQEVCLSLVLAATLAALVVIDYAHFRLPNALTFPLIAAGIVLVPPFGVGEVLLRLGASLVGYGLIYVAAEGYRAWRGQSGIGMGDAKLFAAAGAWCGFWALPSVLFLAALAALVVTLAAAVQVGASLTRTSRIAFGPYLATALWIVWMFGAPL